MFERADSIIVDNGARRGVADIEDVAEISEDAVDKSEMTFESGGDAGQRETVASQTRFFPRSFTLPAAPPLDALSSDKWAVGRLAFQALGVVYGDIGTSPLYVLNGIFPTDGPVPPKEDVIGIISTIVWIFTIVVMVKYAAIVLRFGTGLGEGGTFALYQGLFPRRICDEDTAERDEEQPSGKNKDRRALLLRYRWCKPLLCAIALLGSALTMADGVLTPAVSVLSAAEGIRVVKPEIGNATVPISIAILAALVLLQSLGVKRLAFLFSPCVLLWFLFLFITGAVNCHAYPGIWRAYDPSRAVLYFVRTGNYDALGGVLLAITGCEALFANLGQLGRRGIQIPLVLVVYPSLMLAYLGQGAKLITDGPTVLPNIFYLTIPGGQGNAVYWIGFATGLLATIIASQALLTACFSIVSQLVHMRCLPSLKQKFPSDDYGQVYIPVVNYTLGVLIIVAVGAFGSSAKLLNAYGFAVITVMLITTFEIALSIFFVKRLPWVLGLLFFVAFGFVDALLWGAVAKKVPEGAWFSLTIGAVLWLIMLLWTWGTQLVDTFDRANRVLLSDFLVAGPDATSDQGSLLVRALDGREKPLLRNNCSTIFWRPVAAAPEWANGATSSPQAGHDNAQAVTVPHSFAHFLTMYPSTGTRTVFLARQTFAVPSIEEEKRLVVRPLVDGGSFIPGFYTATLRLGYKDHVEMGPLNAALSEQMAFFEGKSALFSIDEACDTMTHIYPSYYPAAKPLQHSARNLGKDASKLPSVGVAAKLVVSTAVDVARQWLIEEIYRRTRAALAEEDGPFDAREQIIRVTITAVV
ncbi:potassium transporter [Acaromyces ingoldii]|uniref:Potassium transporter n=1 Tax=Acaromyces ingoldii TaxID=215250 RepID=A0A316YPQ6_9BASI|nr:potassium transporter [Acaromyces ingoldii]PWN89725.1 potassium transporter [Acaromyces ingoldii]